MYVLDAHSGSVVRQIDLPLQPMQAIVVEAAHRLVTRNYAYSPEHYILVSVLDLRTGSVMTAMDMQGATGPLTVDLRTGRIYASWQDEVGVFDVQTGHHLTTINPWPAVSGRPPGGSIAGGFPTALGLDAASGHLVVDLYASRGGSGTVSTIDLTHRTLLRAVPSAGRGASVDRRRGRAYLLMQSADLVPPTPHGQWPSVLTIVDTQTGRLLRMITGRPQIAAQALDEQRGRLYLVNTRDGTVSAYDVSGL